jgi:hypothetical protein
MYTMADDYPDTSHYHHIATIYLLPLPPGDQRSSPSPPPFPHDVVHGRRWTQYLVQLGAGIPISVRPAE